MLHNLLRLSLALGIFALPVAQAAPLWVGTADYKLGPGATTDEDKVGPFDSYDFGVGVALLEDNAPGSGGNPQAPQVGDVYNGFIQAYVVDHLLGGSGVLSDPNLDTTGSGSGGTYELTLRGDFMETITAVDAVDVNFDITGGTASLYFDTTPDYLFSDDSGFGDAGGTDGGAILTGTIVGGTGAFFPSAQFGATSIDLLVTSFDTFVFDPDTIQSGSSVFTLQLTPGATGFLSTVHNVQGNAVDGTDLLLAADGNLTLFAVPEPLSLLLVGSAVGGLVMIRRRSRG